MWNDVILMYNIIASLTLHSNSSMSITNLRKVGGSIMLAVPPSILSLLKLEPGSSVDVAVQKGRLVIEPVKKPKYTLEELVAQCKTGQKRSLEDDTWLNDGPVGKELL